MDILKKKDLQQLPKHQSNEQKDHQPENPPNQIGVWLVIGAGVGTLLRKVFYNAPIGAPSRL